MPHCPGQASEHTRCSEVPPGDADPKRENSSSATPTEPPATTRLGITWLELYVVYRLSGYPPPIPPTTPAATSRPTLRQQLHHFRATVRLIATNTFAPEDRWLFRGMHTKYHRLRTLGITTHLATLPWQPSLTLPGQRQIAVEILRSQHGFSGKHAEATLREGRQVKLHRLRLKGRSKWSRTIPTSVTSPFGDAKAGGQPDGLSSGTASSVWVEGQSTGNPATPPYTCTHRIHPPHTTPAPPAAHSSNHPLPAVLMLRCPKCPHHISGAKVCFNLTSLDTKTWCNQCKRSWAVTRWECPCQLPWHTCPRHRDEPARLRNTTSTPHEQPSTTPPPPAPHRKKALGQGRDTAVHTWLDQPPPKRRRQEPRDVELGATPPPTGIRPHLLGPKLRAKFLSPPDQQSTRPAIGHHLLPPQPPHPAPPSTAAPQASTQVQDR